MGEAQIYCTSSILFTGSLDEAAPFSWQITNNNIKDRQSKAHSVFVGQRAGDAPSAYLFPSGACLITS